jgi:hypothetical protein
MHVVGTEAPGIEMRQAEERRSAFLLGLLALIPFALSWCLSWTNVYAVPVLGGPMHVTTVVGNYARGINPVWVGIWILFLAGVLALRSSSLLVMTCGSVAVAILAISVIGTQARVGPETQVGSLQIGNFEFVSQTQVGGWLAMTGVVLLLVATISHVAAQLGTNARRHSATSQTAAA